LGLDARFVAHPGPVGAKYGDLSHCSKAHRPLQYP